MVAREAFLEIPVALAAFAAFAAHFCLPRTAAEAYTCGANYVAVMRAGVKCCPLLMPFAWLVRTCGLEVLLELENSFRFSHYICACKRSLPQWDDPVDHEDAQAYATELERVLLSETIRWNRLTRSGEMTEEASLLADQAIANSVHGNFEERRKPAQADYAIDDRGEAVSMAVFFDKAFASVPDQQPWERSEHRPASRNARASHGVGFARTRTVNAERGNASGTSAAAAATAPQPTADRRSKRRPKKSSGHCDHAGSGEAVSSTHQSQQYSVHGLSGIAALDAVGSATASHAALDYRERDITQAAAGEVSEECLVCWERLGALELGRAPQFCDHDLCMSCASKVLCCPFCGVPRTGTPRGLARAAGISSTMPEESVGSTVSTSATYAHHVDDYVDD